MHSPARIVLPADEKEARQATRRKCKIAAAIAGKELVTVSAEDIGIEAVDDYTVRISLSQSVTYFSGVLPHQFFRLVPRKAIETYGDQWTNPSNIVTCGAFKLKSWTPYSEVVVEKDPMYWDVGNVHLDTIRVLCIHRSSDQHESL